DRRRIGAAGEELLRLLAGVTSARRDDHSVTEPIEVLGEHYQRDRMPVERQHEPVIAAESADHVGLGYFAIVAETLDELEDLLVPLRFLQTDVSPRSRIIEPFGKLA